MSKRKCKIFSPDDWEKGTRIERREHRISTKIAKKISRDHLCENPRYYTGRKKFGSAIEEINNMERELAKLRKEAEIHIHETFSRPKRSRCKPCPPCR